MDSAITLEAVLAKYAADFALARVEAHCQLDAILDQTEAQQLAQFEAAMRLMRGQAPH